LKFEKTASNLYGKVSMAIFQRYVSQVLGPQKNFSCLFKRIRMGNSTFLSEILSRKLKLLENFSETVPMHMVFVIHKIFSPFPGPCFTSLIPVLRGHFVANSEIWNGAKSHVRIMDRFFRDYHARQ